MGIAFKIKFTDSQYSEIRVKKIQINQELCKRNSDSNYDSQKAQGLITQLDLVT